MVPEHDDTAEALTRAIEAMNACITTAEVVFRRLHLGVAASTPFPAETGPDATSDVRWLRFGKRGSSWTLMVMNEDLTTTPLLNCGLRTRRAALPLLPALHERLILAAQDTTSSIGRAVADATVFLDSLAKPATSTFCVHCPGEGQHKMSCTAAKGGFVQRYEPCHEQDLSKLLPASAPTTCSGILAWENIGGMLLARDGKYQFRCPECSRVGEAHKPRSHARCGDIP